MIAAVLLVCAVVLQASPPASAVEDPALAAAVARFFETQEKEDVAGYLALWSSKAARPTADQLKFVFDRGADKFSDITITRVTPFGNRTRVRVDVRRERVSAPTAPGRQPMSAGYKMSIALTFEKEGGEWKLLREGPASDDLAAALLEASSEAERDGLLAAEPDLPGPLLLSSMARFAGTAAAKQDYRESQRIYEVLVAVAKRGGFRKEEGEGLQNIGNALYFQRRFPEALAAYEQRLVLERDRQDEAGIAGALSGIATIRYSLAEYTEALARYREALALQEKMDDVAGIAFTLISVGNIGYLQGDFQSAIAAYRRSLELNRTMSNADGESRALEGLGRVYVGQGDYGGALEAFNAVRADKRLEHARARLGAVTQNIGEVHFRLGNLDAARASYGESRAHFEAVKDMPNVGRVLQGVALTELVAAKFELAQELYTKSGSICDAADDRECSASALSGLAYAQAAQENYFGAAASYRKAIEAFTALRRLEDAARSSVGLSQALAGAEDYAGAIEAAIAARREALSLQSDDLSWRALTAEARAVRKNGDRERALGIARAAVAALDRMEIAAFDRPGGSLPSEAGAALATFAVLQAESGDAAGAFATSERLRAVDVRAGLATNERDISRGMTDQEREQERALAAQLMTALAQVARERGLPRQDPDRLAALQKSAAEATAARRAGMQQLYERYPALREWRGLGTPRQASDAAALLSAPGDVLVSFVLDDDDVVVLVVTRQPIVEGAAEAAAVTVEGYVAPAKRRAFAEHVLALQQSPALNDAAVWRKAASEILALLPGPASRRMADATRLFVLPHDVLWRVPFEALPDGEAWIGDGATVTVGGSLDSLLRSASASSARADAMIGVGATDVSAARLERLKQVAPSWPMRAVELADAEVKAASAAYEQGRATVLAAAGATESGVRQGMHTAPVLHIAAPFRINAASPLFSPVLLTVAETAPPPADAQSGASAAPAPQPPRVLDAADNGSLELREIMNLETAVRIAVFSDGAATTMRDGAAAADVLQWGWLAAGVPSVLLSRWGTPAAGGNLLLTEFHKQLQAGTPPAEALRAAQRSVRGTIATAAPIYWAGWMVLGAR